VFLTVLGATLLTPAFADAQIFRRGSGWGVGYSDGNVGIGYGSGYYGRGYGYGDGWGYGRGYGWNNPGYGYGNYPGYYGGSGFIVGLGSGYYGGGYNYPGYAYGGSMYTTPMYGSSGYIDGSGYMGNTGMMSGNIYQAGYMSGMNLANVVRLDIIVPEDNTELMIQGQKVGGFGRHRTFVSPQLEQGKEYTYTISIAQARDGESTKKIDVKAGGQYTVDFVRQGPGERLPAPGAGFETDRRRDADTRDINRDTRNIDRPIDRPGTTPPIPRNPIDPPR
jgi:uncharacterized protein (TIGR03000 family)